MSLVLCASTCCSNIQLLFSKTNPQSSKRCFQRWGQRGSSPFELHMDSGFGIHQEDPRNVDSVSQS